MGFYTFVCCVGHRALQVTVLRPPVVMDSHHSSRRSSSLLPGRWPMDNNPHRPALLSQVLHNYKIMSLILHVIKELYCKLNTVMTSINSISGHCRL